MQDKDTAGGEAGESCCCCPSGQTVTATADCCGPPAIARGGEIDENVPGYLGWHSGVEGRIPRISSHLTLADRFGTCRVRLGFGRMSYLVPPGLYAIGSPCPDDPVIVTANYKMSYDAVRGALGGRNAWLLVLETFGVNVWCAAGKGSFGTSELTHRIEQTGLARIVSHRRLFLPILGAPGIAAHEVQKRTGFNISYAAVRAEDLPTYLDNGMVTSPRMRELTFSMRERLVLIPVEIMLARKSLAVAGVALFGLATMLSGAGAGVRAVGAFLGAAATGLIAVPLFLPWIPGKSFSLKGALAGGCWVTLFLLLTAPDNIDLRHSVSAFLALPAVSAYYALSFTGCTTFTSRSGVKKEMRIALPLMAAALLLGGAVAIAGYFA